MEKIDTSVTPLIDDEKRLQADAQAPNAKTQKAMAELEAGKGDTFANVADLMADLQEGD